MAPTKKAEPKKTEEKKTPSVKSKLGVERLFEGNQKLHENAGHKPLSLPAAVIALVMHAADHAAQDDLATFRAQSVTRMGNEYVVTRRVDGAEMYIDIHVNAGGARASAARNRAHALSAQLSTVRAGLHPQYHIERHEGDARKSLEAHNKAILDKEAELIERYKKAMKEADSAFQYRLSVSRTQLKAGQFGVAIFSEQGEEPKE